MPSSSGVRRVHTESFGNVNAGHSGRAFKEYISALALLPCINKYYLKEVSILAKEKYASTKIIHSSSHLRKLVRLSLKKSGENIYEGLGRRLWRR